MPKSNNDLAAPESPSVNPSAEGSLPFGLARNEGRLILFVLAMKALLLWVGVVSAEIYTNQRLGGPTAWLDMWYRWDTTHYLEIAEKGYVQEGDLKYNLAFFPLYPLLIRIGMLFGMAPIAAAIFVTTIASLFAAVFMYRLFHLDVKGNAARRSVWLFFAFPTAYFLHIGYTESLFFAFTLGAFYQARQRRWLWAGVFGFFAMTARMNALLLLPALLLEIWSEWRETRRFNKSWGAVLAIVLGVVLYLVINYSVTGNPLTFLSFQKEHWNHNLAPPWAGILNAIRSASGFAAADGQLVGVMEALFGILGLLACIAIGIYCRPSYVLWSVGNWVLFCSMDFITSTPRYTLLLFPLFLLLGRITARPTLLMMLLAWGLLFQGIFAGLFAQGRWAF